jgi:hypothetical protein
MSSDTKKMTLHPDQAFFAAVMRTTNYIRRPDLLLYFFAEQKRLGLKACI